MTNTKTISVSLCVPVVFELEVGWDSDGETTDIKGVRLAQIQPGYTPKSLCEHLGEDDFEEIDRLTKIALGIED